MADQNPNAPGNDAVDESIGSDDPQTARAAQGWQTGLANAWKAAKNVTGDVADPNDTRGLQQGSMLNPIDWAAGAAGAKLGSDAMEVIGNEAGQLGSKAAEELPMDEASRLARQKELYPNEGWYHGTSADIKAFKLNSNSKNGAMLGQGVYLTNDPSYAEEYATKLGQNKGLGSKLMLPGVKEKAYQLFPEYSNIEDEHTLANKIQNEADTKPNERSELYKFASAQNEAGGNIIPVVHSASNSFDIVGGEDPKLASILKKEPEFKNENFPKGITDNYNLMELMKGRLPAYRITQILEDRGYDSVIDKTNGILNIFDPKKIRSKFATFDPKKAGQNGLSYDKGGVVRKNFADGGDTGALRQTTQQPNSPQLTNVISPEGDLVSVPNEQLPLALHPTQGYRLATPEDEANYEQQQKYGTPGQALQAAGEGALRTATFGAIPGVGSKEAIAGREQANPIASGLGEAIPFAAEQFIPGVGEAADVSALGRAGQALTAAPRAIAAAGQAITDASGLTGVGAKALTYAAENMIMQGSSEVSKMLLSDPAQSTSSAIANEGMAAVLGGALGAAAGGVGKVGAAWAEKFGQKATDAIVEGGIPDIASQELRSGIDIPDSMKDALAGNQDSYSKWQTIYKSDGFAGKAARTDAANLYDQAENKTLETLGASPKQVEVAPNAYKAGSDLKDALTEVVKGEQQQYGPIYDELKSQYHKIPVSTDQKVDLAGKLTKALSDAGIGAYKGSVETSAAANLLSSIDEIGTADGIKNLNTGLNNAARNPELQRLAAVAGPVIKDFESSVVQNHLTQVAAGSAPKQLGKLAKAVSKAIKAGSPDAAVEATGQYEEALGKLPKSSAADAQKAADLLSRRKVADAAYKQAMGTMNDLKGAIGLGRFKGTNGFLRALDEKSPEQVLKRLTVKNRQELVELLQNKFPKAAEIVKNYHLNEMLNDAKLPTGGLNTKKFLNNFLDQAQNPGHIQGLVSGGAPQLSRLDAIKGILNAIPKDGNPSDSAAMLNQLWKGKIGTTMGAIMGVGGGHVTGGFLGGIGEHLMGEVKPFLSYKTLEMRGAGKNVVPEQVRAMYDYAKSVASGHALINKAVNGLVNSGTIVPPSKAPTQHDKDQLDKYAKAIQQDPNHLQNTAQDLQNSMQDHASNLGLKATQTANYINSIRPTSPPGLPQDAKMPVSRTATAEYQRQLAIVQQPLTILQHVKDGTLTTTDLQTMQACHSDIYQQLRTKIMSEVMNPKLVIPYQTRLSMSAFLGQPLDSTMTPQSIISAQPQPSAPSQPQPGAMGKPKRGTSSLGKAPTQFQTKEQAAEASQIKRD